MNQSPRALRTLSTVAAALLVAVLLLPLAACGGDEPPPPPAADVAPIPSSGAAAPAAGGQAAGITWDWPADWQQQAPSTNMRMAQASIPGDAGAADFVVFFFGPGGGGGTEANLARWVGQVEQPEGREPQHEEFQVGDYRVYWVEVEGTLLASTMGTGPSTPQADSRLIGAVVEGPGGPWFFKITGPNKTVLDARDTIRGVLESIRPA